MVDLQTGCLACGAILEGIDLLDRLCWKHKGRYGERPANQPISVKIEIPVSLTLNLSQKIEIYGQLKNGTVPPTVVVNPPEPNFATQLTYPPSGATPFAASGISLIQGPSVSGGSVTYQFPPSD